MVAVRKPVFSCRFYDWLPIHWKWATKTRQKKRV